VVLNEKLKSLPWHAARAKHEPIFGINKYKRKKTCENPKPLIFLGGS